VAAGSKRALSIALAFAAATGIVLIALAIRLRSAAPTPPPLRDGNRDFISGGDHGSRQSQQKRCLHSVSD
jgi:hypothetical protein